ncbi:MAG: class D beta-lactamase [Bacteroidales bacterium]|nr:class D beta-lactamase [Bacteroidales bacterium]
MNKYIFYFLLGLSLESTGQKSDTVDLRSFFGDFDGGFCVYDLSTDHYIRHNPEHCNKQFSPCSTFKIPNSLIGLETGVIADTAFVIPHDSIRHPKDPELMYSEPFRHWYQDLSLKQAFQFSCVWYYQELARRVGQDRMEKYVDQLDYGNGDISSGVDNYWLCRSLQISIDEQIGFLKRFYQQQLCGFSQKNMEAVKQIMLYETAPGYRLYGKTGGGDCWENRTIGWYVGFVETDTGVKIFAMNVLVNSFDDLQNNFRIELTKKILKELKMI